MIPTDIRLKIFLAIFIGGSLVSCGPGEEEALHLLKTYFSDNRYPGPKNMEKRADVQNSIIKLFKDQNLHVEVDEFLINLKIDDNRVNVKGKNIIGLMKGNNWMNGSDDVFLIGAHYDTAEVTRGVNDNGSGMVAMIQTIRSLRKYLGSCGFNNTILFVAFDINAREYKGESNDKAGSKSFIEHFLKRKVLSSNKLANFKGSIILDGLLNYNDSRYTQDIPKDLINYDNSVYNQMSMNKAGDFLLMVTRKSQEDGPEEQDSLADSLYNAWNNVTDSSNDFDDRFRLLTLPIFVENRPTGVVKMFTLQDHWFFWKPMSSNAILLTDTGKLRGYMRNCHHKPCDDISQVQPVHLRFLVHIVKILTYLTTKKGIMSCAHTPPAAASSAAPIQLKIGISFIIVPILINKLS